MYILKRFRLLLLLPVLIVVIGTIGIMIIEHLSFLDALYFTIVTIATVGYGDVSPVTTGGKIFSIFLIILGIGAFVTLLTNAAQWFVQRRQLTMHQNHLNMLIGVFFTEVGNRLLRVLARYDPKINSVRKDFLVTPEWSDEEYTNLLKRLNSYGYSIDPDRVDFNELHHFLQEKGELIIRQLENTDMVENETFTELLWAVVHLRDELAARSSLAELPATDIEHLVSDVKRIYLLLTQEWLVYLRYLKNRYPFLFSLALRTNPFVENPSAIIK